MTPRAHRNAAESLIEEAKIMIEEGGPKSIAKAAALLQVAQVHAQLAQLAA